MHLTTSVLAHLFELFVRIVAPLPLSVAYCERVRSEVKTINGYLRASMWDERLESLIQISTETDTAHKLVMTSTIC